MTEHTPLDPRDAEFERRARDAFAASVEDLDAATLSRLNQSRQGALAVVRRRHSSGPRWWLWAPAGAIAAGALVAALLLRSPADTGDVPVPVAATAPAADAQQDPLEVLAAGEDLELAAEADLDFYEWVELETAAADDGVG